MEADECLKIIYAKSVFKDLKKIATEQLPCIKEGIKELEKFPNILGVTQLKFEVQLLQKVGF